MTIKAWAEQGEYQWTWQVAWGKGHEPYPYAKYYRQLSKAESERGGPPPHLSACWLTV